MSEIAFPTPNEFALSGRTQIVGVIGWPIEHSLSPAMQNAALRALGLDWCYVPFAVPPERVVEALTGVRALGIRGVNATVPHKQALLPLMDQLTPEARAIGAVNTVIAQAGSLIGHNTDAAGFMRALHQAGFDPQGCSALVLGAGGAARAVVYALASVGAQVTIVNRTLEHAQALAAAFGGLHSGTYLGAAVQDTQVLRRIAPQASLIVNTTPLGMWPHVDTSPWPEAVDFPAGAVLFDLVYNPRETHLMRQARARGAMAMDGLWMLVHQGAEALKLWTGVEPPIAVMHAACTARLGGD